MKSTSVVLLIIVLASAFQSGLCRRLELINEKSIQFPIGLPLPDADVANTENDKSQRIEEERSDVEVPSVSLPLPTDLDEAGPASVEDNDIKVEAYHHHHHHSDPGSAIVWIVVGSVVGGIALICAVIGGLCWLFGNKTIGEDCCKCGGLLCFGFLSSLGRSSCHCYSTPCYCYR